MSEDKKVKKDLSVDKAEEKDIKADTSAVLSADKKSADVKVVPQTATQGPSQMRGERDADSHVSKKESKKEKDIAMPSIDGLEELPEEVKKKLEKKKSEKKPGKGKVKKKKKAIKNVSVGRAYIKATYNNTIVSLTDLNGDIISWASAGIAGFKGPKKSTPYAAQIITRIAVEKARESGLKEVCVYVKGVGTGRESAVRALNANGLIVTYIKDVTPVPHNGCRKRKPRRV